MSFVHIFYYCRDETVRPEVDIPIFLRTFVEVYLSDNPKLFMDRIFHARIAVGQYLLLALVTVVTVWNLWEKHIVLAAVFMLLLVVSIERLIHTTYTLTRDGRLVLYYGRFSRVREIRVEDIVSVQRSSSMQIGGRAVMRYVLVRCKDGRCHALMPVKEEEFIRALGFTASAGGTDNPSDSCGTRLR